MRTTFVAIFFFAVALAAVSCSEQEQENRDLIDTFLPLFGKKKLNTLITQRTIDFVKRFFDLNPKYYTNIKEALAPEGVTIPEQSQMKWDVVQKEDFETLTAMIGEATLADAINDKEFFENFVSEIESDPALVARLESRVRDSGIQFGDDADVDAILAALSKQITTGFLAAFAPIGMQIMWFGKRAAADAIIAEPKKVDLQAIWSSGAVQQVISQLIKKVQQLLASNPAMSAVFTQFISQFLHSSRKLSFNLSQIISAINQLIPILTTVPTQGK